jgi:thiol-disulfide isomerase/thioredoxin
VASAAEQSSGSHVMVIKAQILILALFMAIQSIFLGTDQAFAQSLERRDSSTIGKTFLTSDSGQRIQISDLLGRVVFINFWGSWCAPCIDEMKSILDLQVRLVGYRRDIAYVFISAKQKEFQKDREWLKQHGMEGQNYQWEPRFPEQRYAFFGALPDQTSFAVPTTYVLDRDGAVAEFAAAPVDWRTHSAMFLHLLARRPAAQRYLY